MCLFYFFTFLRQLFESDVWGDQSIVRLDEAFSGGERRLPSARRSLQYIWTSTSYLKGTSQTGESLLRTSNLDRALPIQLLDPCGFSRVFLATGRNHCLEPCSYRVVWFASRDSRLRLHAALYSRGRVEPLSRPKSPVPRLSAWCSFRLYIGFVSRPESTVVWT